MMAVLGLGVVEILLMMFGVGIALVVSLFWIWMLVDCIRNRTLDPTEKLIWVLVIALTHFVGALIYLLAGRSGRLST